MAKRPHTYEHADKLGRDGQACLDFAWLVWLDLSPTMQKAMVDAYEKDIHGGRRVIHPSPSCRATTADALMDRGLIEDRPSRFLTLLGVLVREAGVLTRIES